MVDYEELNNLLNMLPMDILREIAYKKGIKIKERNKNNYIREFIKNLKSTKTLDQTLVFTEEEIEELIEFVKKLEEEDKPIRNYLMKISDVNLHELKKKFEKNKAEFNEEGKLKTDGYEIIEYVENEYLKVRRWVRKEKYFLSTSGKPDHTEKTDFYEFEIDLKEGMFISHAPFGISRGILKELRTMDVHFSPVGLQDIERNSANKQFQEFIKTLDEKLRRLE